MKNRRNLFIAATFFITLAGLCISSCSKKDKADGAAVIASNGKQKAAATSYTPIKVNLENDRASFKSMTEFFTPVYSVQLPDEALAQKNSENQNKAKKGKKQGCSKKNK